MKKLDEEIKTIVNSLAEEQKKLDTTKSDRIKEKSTAAITGFDAQKTKL